MTLLLQILAVLAFLAVWGFIIMGMVMNAQVWWIALHAKEGDQIPSGVTFIFGLLGAGLVWMMLPMISKISGAEVAWIDVLARTTAEAVQKNQPQPAQPLSIIGLVLRNLFFFFLVLAHGLRRLLPPY